jgi:hypothetical protein
LARGAEEGGVLEQAIGHAFAQAIALTFAERRLRGLHLLDVARLLELR